MSHFEPDLIMHRAASTTRHGYHRRLPHFAASLLTARFSKIKPQLHVNAIVREFPADTSHTHHAARRL
jgi:hypothetical protein